MFSAPHFSEKPKLSVEMDFSVSRGEAVCFDERGNWIGTFSMATGKAPANARTVKLSPEDYMPLVRRAGHF